MQNSTLQWFVFWCSVLAFVSSVFVLHPELDIRISMLFFDTARGEFKYTYHPFWRAVQKTTTYATYGFVGYLLLCLAARKLPATFQRALFFGRWQATYLLSSIALCAGFLVHEVVKEIFGRARPELTQPFGGDLPFTAAWQLSDAAGKSFISGHAATGFFFTALAVCVPARWRTHTLAITLLLAILISAGRVVQGRHFASDVLVAACLAVITNVVLYLFLKERLIIERKP